MFLTIVCSGGSIFSSSELLAYPGYNYSILLNNIPHSSDVNRKATIKLGRISDTDILNSIKNNTSDSWKNLLTFAKADTNSLLNTSSSSDHTDFLSFKGKTNIKASQLVNEAYYYLYVELDDENGKYYPVEGVTLTQANIIKDDCYMIFYGDSEFNLSIPSDDTSASKTASENTTVDQTTANIKLP